MLRDMTDSRRIDQHVQAQKQVSASNEVVVKANSNIYVIKSFLHPTIISKHFWPPLATSNLQMPGQFKRQVHLSSETLLSL